MSFEDVAHRMDRDPTAPIPISDLFPSREYNPWLPPGYYVARPDGSCAHCGADEDEHEGWPYPTSRFVPHPTCPRAPLELRRPTLSLPPAA